MMRYMRHRRSKSDKSPDRCDFLTQKGNLDALFRLLGIIAVMILHIVGARYIYSYVPYSEWIVSTGIVDAGFFSGNRNYYDRFVHFMFGFLLFPYIMFLCRKRLRLGDMTAILFSWLIIQTGSMIYELFEWLLTVFMAPEDAESYNGQQGDIWDAQKDMALALIGSTIPAVWYWWKRVFRRGDF